MGEENKDLLIDEIKREIDNLSFLEDGSEEKSKAIDDLVKLYKLRIEEIKIEKEFDEKWHRRVMDTGIQEDEVRTRNIRMGIDVAGIVLPMIFYAVWMNKGFKFEETGTFTSTTFRGLFNRFRPTK